MGRGRHERTYNRRIRRAARRTNRQVERLVLLPFGALLFDNIFIFIFFFFFLFIFLFDFDFASVSQGIFDDLGGSRLSMALLRQNHRIESSAMKASPQTNTMKENRSNYLII